MKAFIAVITFLLTFQAYAWSIDFTTDVVTEAFKTASEQKSSRQFFLIGALGDLGKGERTSYQLGFGVISASAKDTNDTKGIDQTYSTLDLGPLFRTNFGRNRVYSLSLMYALYAKGKLDQNGASETISGSSYLVKLGIEPEINEQLHIGFSLNYYAAQYSKSVTNAVESDVSYQFQRMFPSISLSYRF